jgi:hypothetical protein
VHPAAIKIPIEIPATAHSVLMVAPSSETPGRS